MPGDDASGWDAIIPVKRLQVAKSRLAPLGDPQRRALAVAFLTDVVVAASRCSAIVNVLVVCADEAVASLVTALGARVVREDGDAGHDAAVALGIASARESPSSRGVVVLSSDLPALDASELAALLAQVSSGGSALVADEEGEGTTMLLAAAGVALVPSYGPGSRRRHEQAGAQLLEGTPRLRRDVDTPEQLARAVALGVGAATREALRGQTAGGRVHLDGAP